MPDRWNHARFEEIAADIKDLLDLKAAVSKDNLAHLLRLAFPVVARRYCELLATAGSHLSRPTSGDLLVCHVNDVKQRCLQLRVLDAFPAYGIDRYISRRNGHWGFHTHDVYYGENGRNRNDTVVANALVEGQRGRFALVEEETRTPSEAQEGLAAVLALIPHEVRDLASIRPGELCAASLVYYESTHRNVNEAAQVMVTLERQQILHDLLDKIYGLNVVWGLDEKSLRSKFAAVWKQVYGVADVGVSLMEVMVKLREA